VPFAPGIEISFINSNFRQPVEQLFVTQRKPMRRRRDQRMTDRSAVRVMTRSSVVGLPVNSMAVNLDVCRPA
jgi:hypothetical protein